MITTGHLHHRPPGLAVARRGSGQLRHRLLHGLAASLLGLMAASADADPARGMETGLALQGFTGLLNIPNAHVTGEGTADLMFNTERDPGLSSDRAENYLFSLGLIPYVELGGRISEQDAEDGSFGRRDLSGNAKLALPTEMRYFPALAVGSQDFAGGAAHFESNYVVASQRLGRWPIRVTAGYGTGPDRMEGPFGGVEWQPIRGLNLMAESENERENVGLRYTTPPAWLAGLAQVAVTGKTSFDDDHDEVEWGLALRIPLGLERDYRGPIEVPEREPQPSARAGHSAVELHNRRRSQRAAQPPSRPEPEAATVAGVRRVGQRLADLGFENLQLGVRGQDTLFIAYENHRYNHNELDGLGLVLGTAAVGAPEALERMTVVIKELNLPVLELTVPIDAYRAFIQGPGEDQAWSPVVARVRNGLAIRDVAFGYDARGVRWVEVDGRPRTWARVELKPRLEHFFATEVGLYDYSLALRAEGTIPLWSGAALTPAWDIPLDDSNHFEDGNAFAPFRIEGGLNELFLNQAFKPTGEVLNLTSVGLHNEEREDHYGVLNETVWSPGFGRHQLRTRLGYFESEDDDSREIALGSYRYYHAPMDVMLQATYGQYWYQDYGLSLEAKRFFGDTAVALFYRNTDDQVGGLELTVPLTPRREMPPMGFQITGDPRWEVSGQTSIDVNGNTNAVRPRVAVMPELPQDVRETYLNDDRLNPLYIHRHVMRLRDAYAQWGGR